MNAAAPALDDALALCAPEPDCPSAGMPLAACALGTRPAILTAYR